MSAYLVTADGSQALTFDLVESESWDENAEVTDYNVEIGPDVTDNVRVNTAVCNLEIFATNEPLGSNSFDQAELDTLPITIAAPDQPAKTPTTITVPEWDNGIALRAALTGAGDVVGGALGGKTGTLIGGAVGALAGALLDGPGERDLPIMPNVGLDPTKGQTVTAQTLQFSTSQDFVQKTIDQLRAWKNAAQLLTVVGTKGSVDNMVIEKLNYTADSDTGTGRSITLGLREIRIVQTVTVNAPKPTLPRARTPVSKGAQNTIPTTNKSALKLLTSQIYATMGGPPASATLKGE